MEKRVLITDHHPLLARVMAMGIGAEADIKVVVLVRDINCPFCKGSATVVWEPVGSRCGTITLAKASKPSDDFVIKDPAMPDLPWQSNRPLQIGRFTLDPDRILKPSVGGHP